jgi:hypothetical protein
MNIVILVPSPEYLSYAGARIRYGRIISDVESFGAQLVLTEIGDFAPEEASGDVFIFSKCHDPRAIVAAAILANRGRLVGVDLFDDYFSQFGDSRTARLRNWLVQMLASCTFALTSTEEMAAIVGEYRPELPVHVMNDPAPEVRLEYLVEVLAAKNRIARESQTLSLAWFGVGDNPNFPVGLHDLCAYGGVLRDLGRTGMDLKLRVMTNVRALSAGGLAQLRGLPVATEVCEWTEEGEAQLLAEAFIAFLPVNVQPFSIAKSLNRAFTALSSGCQVLSIGHPLYRRLQRLIYRDPMMLLADFANDSLRLSPARIQEYRTAVEACASSVQEARRLIDFLRHLRGGCEPASTLVLLHGQTTNAAAHKSVQAAGGLSVATPFCAAALQFDVMFTAGGGALNMLVSQEAFQRLRPELRWNAVPAPSVRGKAFLRVQGSESSVAAAKTASGNCEETPLPFELALYSEYMREIRARLADAFAPCRILVSETSPLPFPVLA